MRKPRVEDALLEASRLAEAVAMTQSTEAAQRSAHVVRAAGVALLPWAEEAIRTGRAQLTVSAKVQAVIDAAATWHAAQVAADEALERTADRHQGLTKDGSLKQLHHEAAALETKAREAMMAYAAAKLALEDGRCPAG